jgi:protein-tyrosine phosphatase
LIDLHCHILPGLDDGPSGSDESVAMARVALESGVGTIVATPHVRDDYPYPLEEIPTRTAGLNAALQRAGLSCRVVAGAEVAMARAARIDDADLRELCLGDSHYLLLESPYGPADDLLEELVFEVQLRGFRPVLAHPERSPSFQSNPERLRGLVERGVLCSLTGASITGGFGRRVRDFALRLVSDDLVHNVASDAHDARRRVPTLRPAVDSVASEYAGGDALGEWLVSDVPSAILEDHAPPERPSARRRGVRGLARLRRGR